MKTVILAEKPDQAKKYASALGDTRSHEGYFEVGNSGIFAGEVIVTWALGHLVAPAPFSDYDKRLKKWSLDACPFLPKKIKFKVIENTKDQFSVVKGQLETADLIIIATDPDREGENVAYSIIGKCSSHVADIPKKRLWINSMVRSEIIRGFQALRPAEDTYARYIEAQTRQISDFLVGLNMTRLFTLRAAEAGLDGTYSIGRVQTPCNAMVVENDMAIKAFRPERFYKIRGIVNKEGQKVTFLNNQRYDSRTDVNDALQYCGMEGPVETVIAEVEKIMKSTPAPRLFDLGGVQRYANSKWGFSLDKTLTVLQSLYQKGLLSYPRTDCDLITKNEFSYLSSHLSEYMQLASFSFSPVNMTPRPDYVDNDSVLEHYAIIPTEMIPSLSDLSDTLSDDEQLVYLAVLKRTVMMFAEDYIYEATTVTIDIGGQIFKAQSNMTLEYGWRGLDGVTRKTAQPMPSFTEGESVTFYPEVKDGYTEAPDRLTEASLGGKDGEMDKLNLGTPATRSEIIKTLVTREYIRVEKTKLYPTDKGVLLYESTKHTLLGKPEMTKLWEDTLCKIGSNRELAGKRQQQFIQNIHKFCISASADLKEKELPEALVQRIRDNGVFRIGSYKICETKKTYRIDGPDGAFTIWKKRAGKTISQAQLRKLLVDGRTGLIKGFKSKSGKSFSAYLILKGTDVEMKYDITT